MKHLILNNPSYQYLEKSFAEWLDILGYAKTTVNNFPTYIRELLHYLEENNISSIVHVQIRHIRQFILYLQGRPNLMFGGSLSNTTINNFIQAINTFGRYLYISEKHHLDIHIRSIEDNASPRIVLSVEEIQALYDASFETTNWDNIAAGQRDRAIIAIFYGCGLRKSEGEQLNTDDILIEKGLVLVRKGKGNKERFVPIAGKHLDDLQRYLSEGRLWFLEDHEQSNFYRRTGKVFSKKKNTHDEALFLSTRGQRMGESAFYCRLKILRERAGIQQQFSLHNLRHSIATHLLQYGMPIEEIRRFLGHSSLESTQIYTHIVNEIKLHQEKSLHVNLQSEPLNTEH